MKSAVLVAVLAGFSATGFAQQTAQERHHPVPPGQPARPHGPATPFDHAKAVHHFNLHDDGGTIDVSVKDPKDETSLHALRLHLQRLALQLGEGDISMPRPAPAGATASPDGQVTFVTRSAAHHEVAGHHGTESSPSGTSAMFFPGAATLGRLKSEVKYTYASTSAGARIEILTTNEQAVQAVHDFLRFQISEHRTGDMNAIVRRAY